MALTAAATVTACDTMQTLTRAGYREPTGAAALVADEPSAALVGRQVLASGGTAVDAAIATAFALSVTYPVAASLGGGGRCLTYAKGTNQALAYDFAPQAASGGGTIAVPTMARGLARLHAEQGRTDWARLVQPAEDLARNGFPVSRALAGPMMRGRELLMVDPGMAATFGRGDGMTVEEGQVLRQAQLASVLATIKNRGAGELYQGTLAREMAPTIARLGGTVSENDLRNVQVQVGGPERTTLGETALGPAVLLTPPGQGGAMLAQLWPQVAQGAAPQALADASRQAFAAAGSTGETAKDPSATGLVVVDDRGNAVACTFTMNRPFGTAQTVTGTGIVLAAAPEFAAGARLAVPAIVVSPGVDQNVFLAAASTGGAEAPVALAQTAAPLFREPVPEDLAAVLNAARVYDGNDDDGILFEATLPAEAQAALRGSGRKVREADALGRVLMVFCADGLYDDPRGCLAASDPRGSGLATVTGR
ncbi:gamma-glutamyltransferase [Zavarzinia sp. CC-PAN008]|uniref:gamma-glutamyltransferase n=1 Tax=Zavarzinia sp. CC-PAN008 TaxID=3243332 RepID=UPI003F742480